MVPSQDPRDGPSFHPRSRDEWQPREGRRFDQARDSEKLTGKRTGKLPQTQRRADPWGKMK